MKRVIKIIIIALVIILGYSGLNKTLAYYNADVGLTNIFETEKYKFSINATGGSFNKDKVIIDGKKVSLPTPIRKGYDFLGFSSSNSGKVEYTNYIDDVKKINNKNIFAKWDVINYQISYDLDGGSISKQPISYTVEDNISLPTPDKRGFEFLGWSGTDLNAMTKKVVIPKGSIGNKSYKANWKINTYTVDVNSIIQKQHFNSGKEGFTFSVWIDGKLIADNVIDYYSNSVSYGSDVRVLINERDGYNIKSFKDKTFTVTNDLSITAEWFDDIPPTITSFRVTNLGLYDPSAGASKGWNVNIFIEAFDNGTGIQKYQTWLAPYKNGAGAARKDGNYRELRNVLYLETEDGRTFCAYAIDAAGNEASKCETIKVH